MLVAGVVGLTMVVVGGYNVVRLSRAAGWPETAGVVESSELTEDDAGVDVGPTGPKSEVAFGYRVNGRHYTSEYVRVSGNAVGGRRHFYGPAMAKRYPVGTAVRVAYDPADPADALLLPLVGSGGAYAEAIVGAVFLAGYAGFLFRPGTGVWWQRRLVAAASGD